MLLALALAHAAPEGVRITYTARFDLNATGDQLCAITKLCDCTATWTGEGSAPVVDGSRVTWKGTWALSQSSCHDSFLIWTPADGTAWHTLRLSADGARVDEWVVHGTAANHTKLSTGIKAGKQFWIDGLGAPWTGKGPTEASQSDGGELAMGVRVDTTHMLQIVPSAPK